MHRMACHVTLGICVFVATHNVVAAADRPALEPGIPMSEVLSRWGEPTERVEQESLRREVWVYPVGNVTFRQGAVIDFAGMKPNSHPPSTQDVARGSGRSRATHARIEPPVSTGTVAQPEKSLSTDVIGEVLRSIPSGEEDKSGARKGGGKGPIIRPTPAGLLPPMMAPQADSSEEEP